MQPSSINRAYSGLTDYGFVVLCLFAYCNIANMVHICAEDMSAQELVDSFFAERERLYAGDVVVNGTEETFTTGRAKNSFSSKNISEWIRFDLKQGRLWHEKALSPSQHLISVCGSDALYIKHVEAKQIFMYPPAPPHRFWDPRTFGICRYSDLLDFTTLATFKSDFQEAVAQRRLSVKGPDAEGIVIATLEYSGDSNQSKPTGRLSRFWIDSKRGFVPIRMESQDLDSITSKDGTKVWHPHANTSKAVWTQIGEVWVPTSATVDLSMPRPDSSTFTIRHDLVFDWHTVNPVLHEEDFKLAQLDIPRGSHIVADAREDRLKPIIIQHPSVPDPATLKRILELNAKADKSAPVTSPE
jgi:hypothetical protein